MAQHGTVIRLDNLEIIEKRLQRANNPDDFIQVQAQLNNLERAVQDANPLVQAHFHLASGALKIKAISLGMHHWLRAESSDVLQQALALLAKAQQACEDAVKEAGGWTFRLSDLQRRCAYESCVATTHLRANGLQPDIIFDTSRLDARQRRNYMNALRYRYTLHSSF